MKVVRNMILSAIATKLSDFKNFLTQEYVFRKLKDQYSPCVKY